MLRCMMELSEDVATEFDRTTALVPIEGRPGEFRVDIDPAWSSLVGAHGGYLCALAVRGAESLATDRTVRTAATSFLRTGQIGPATLQVRELRRGRSMSTVVADLVQDERVVITSRMTLATDRRGVEWTVPHPVELPAPDDCQPYDFGDRVSHFGRVESRWDLADGQPFTGGSGRVRAHVRPLDGRSIDAAWLVMASDWFPPPAFTRLEPPTGGVSIDLFSHIHRPGLVLAEGEWLAGEFEIQESAGGLAVERGRIVRADGTLVAESVQTRLTAA